jgi:GNAT superfamily N-acetyltransferase
VTDKDISIEIRQIEPGDKLTGLSLGSEELTPLKTFLQRHAKSYQEKSLARTYALFDMSRSSKVIGYVTLVCGEVVLQDGDISLLGDDIIDYKYLHYPAIKIARLAIDRRYQGFDLGSKLVDLSLGVAKGTVCPAVGCRFVVVDSKKSAVGFYLKAGFTMLDTEANRNRADPVLFVDLQKTPHE